MTTFNELWGKLAESKEYREEFVTAQVKRGIPFQIATLLKDLEISQAQLAERSGLTQGVISRAANPNYGNLTLNTLIRIAAGFDVAFVGKFVPFSELGRWFIDLSEESVKVKPFLQEDRERRSLSESKASFEAELAAHAAVPAPLDADYYANSISEKPVKWNSLAEALNYYQGLHIHHWFRDMPLGGMSNSIESSFNGGYPSNLVNGDVFRKHQEKSKVRRYMGKADSNIPKEALRA